MADTVRYDVYERARQLQAADQEQKRLAAEAAAAEVERTRGRTWGEVGTDSALALSQGIGTLASAAYGVANIPFATLNAASFGMIKTPEQLTGGATSKFFSDWNQAMQEAKSAPLQRQQAEADAAFQDEGIISGAGAYLQNPALLGDLAIKALPSLYPGVAAARAAGTAGTAAGAALGRSQLAQAEMGRLAAEKAVVRTVGAQAAGNAYTDTVRAAKDAGASDEEASLRALGSSLMAGLGTAAITKLTGAGALESNLARMFSGSAAPNVAGQGTKMILGGAAREFTEEGLQSGVEQEAQNTFVQGREFGQDTPKAMTLGAIAGGLLGGGVGSLHTALNGGKPSITRAEMDAQKAAVDAELSGVLRPPSVGDVGVEGAAAVQLREAQERRALAEALPSVTPTSEADRALAEAAYITQNAEVIDLGSVAAPTVGADAGVEEIDVGDTALPLAGLLPESTELTGVRKILAARDIARAQQPPRPGVAELPVEEQTITELPQPASRSVEEVYKSKAPLAGVERRFGAQAAMQEAQRRGVEALSDADVASYFGMAALGRKKAQQQAAPSAVQESTSAPIDVSTKQARAKYAKNIKAELSKATGAPVSGGSDFNALVDAAAQAGVSPGEPQFDAFVAQHAYKALGVRETAGKSANYLGVISNAYPLDPESRARIEAEVVAEKDEGAMDALFVANRDQAPSASLEPAPTEARTTTLQAADASKPAAVTAAAPRYNAPQLAAYLQYPGSAQLDALTQLKQQEANPQPVYAAMAYALDLANSVDELNRVALAVQAHPEYALFPDAQRGELQSKVATALNRVAGITFELSTSPVEAPTALQLALSMDEDAYIAAVNPSGERVSSDDRILLSVGDLSTPTTAQPAGSFNDSNGVQVQVLLDADGVMYARRGGDTLGMMGPMEDGETVIDVVEEAKGQGVGRGLAMAYLRQNPMAPSGGFSIAGEANRRSAFRALKAENAKFNAGHGAVKNPMSASTFTKTTSDLAAKLGVDIRAYDTVADLGSAVGHAVPSNTKGMFGADGLIHVVREKHASKSDLAFTIAHEVGHKGLAKLLGPNLKAATNRMWANAAMRDRVKAKMASLNYATGTEAERKASRTLAAEEVLADMLASNEKLTGDILSKLRSGVREFFAVVLGYRDLVVTNAEVDRLLADVSRVIRGEAAQNVVVGGSDAALWLDSPGAAAAMDAKFSLASADLDILINQAAQEGAARVAPISDISKAAGNAAIDAAKSVASALKHNSVGELYTKNAMHLNQLADWYDSMFGGRIGALANLKRGKEAFFNQQNSRPADLTYEGAVVATQSVNDVAKEWGRFGRQNPLKHAALNNMLSRSTFYKVFPDKPWDAQHDVDYKEAGFDEAARKAAHQQMRAAWEAVGPEGRALYKKSQAIYGARWKTRFDTLLTELDRVGKSYQVDNVADDGTIETLTRYKADIRLAMQRISEGPYSPLQRNGSYLVVARDTAGDVVHFSAYDSKDEAAVAAKQVGDKLTSAGETQAVVAVTEQKDFDMRVDGASRGTMEAMTARIKADISAALPPGMDESARTQLLSSISSGLAEAYMQALPQNAFMQHSKSRKNVEGFDVDAFRAFANYTLRSARDIAGIKFDGLIGSALNDIQTYVKDVTDGKMRPAGSDGVFEVDTTKLQNVASAVRNQHAASLEVSNNRLVNGLSQTAFVYFMTSPSQMFLNATQTYMVAFPRLAGKYGALRAIKELNKAAGHYFKSKFDMLGESSTVRAAAANNPAEAQVADVLQALFESGDLDFTQAHDLAGISNGSNESLSPYFNKAMEVMSYAMHKSEVFNRQVTAAAAVRLEIARRGGATPMKGTAEYATAVEELTRLASDVIGTTHFDYSQSNKPPLMQGPVGKLALQFQQYRFHMLSMIGKDIRDAELGRLSSLRAPSNPTEAKAARETLAWLLGMQLAFVGTAGTVLAPFAFALADAFKDDDDLTSSKQDWINMVGKYAAHGVLSGVVDTQRIGADTLIPYLGSKGYEPVGVKPSEVFMYHVSQNLGPWVGLLGDAVDGTAALANGDVYKASQDLLPKPFRDAIKATYEGVNGARDARQVMYNDPSLWSGVTGFLGLRSGERRDAEAKRSAAYTANARQYNLKDRYLTRMAVGYAVGDGGVIADAQASIDAWNVKHPDLAIKAQDIRRAVVNRIRADGVAAEYGIASGKPPSDSIAAAMGQ